MIVQGYHYTFPAAAYIEKDGNGYRPNPICLAAGAVSARATELARKGRPRAASCFAFSASIRASATAGFAVHAGRSVNCSTKPPSTCVT